MDKLFSALEEDISRPFLLTMLQKASHQKDNLLITGFLLDSLMAEIEKGTYNVSQKEDIVIPCGITLLN